MNCDGEVIHPGQIINILQKKEKNAKNAKKTIDNFPYQKYNLLVMQ